METAPSLSAPETIAANLRMILRGLLAALGAWRLEPARAIVLYGRISGSFGRIERLLVRFRAGRLSRVTPRLGVARQGVRRDCAVRLPRKFGWLVAAGGHQAACYGSQLQTVLATPDMAEMLAASAQARRILRPLCRALAVELPWTVAAKNVVTRRRRVQPRAKPEPFRIPLPRGVLAAARRQGFGKMC